MDLGAFERDLAAGVALFNQRRYFDAHEVWEDRWRLESGEPRRLLHGLIQLAAAFHQLTVLGSPKGFARLLDKSLPKLRALGERCCGVALGPLLIEAEGWRARAHTLEQDHLLRLESGSFPHLEYQRAP
jgi:predicted metal-dependent hydrolase